MASERSLGRDHRADGGRHAGDVLVSERQPPGLCLLIVALGLFYVAAILIYVLGRVARWW